MSGGTFRSRMRARMVLGGVCLTKAKASLMAGIMRGNWGAFTSQTSGHPASHKSVSSFRRQEMSVPRAELRAPSGGLFLHMGAALALAQLPDERDALGHERQEFVEVNTARREGHAMVTR